MRVARCFDLWQRLKPSVFCKTPDFVRVATERMPIVVLNIVILLMLMLFIMLFAMCVQRSFLVLAWASDEPPDFGHVVVLVSLMGVVNGRVLSHLNAKIGEIAASTFNARRAVHTTSCSSRRLFLLGLPGPQPLGIAGGIVLESHLSVHSP